MRKACFFSVAVLALGVMSVGCGGGRGRRPVVDVDSGSSVRLDGSTPPGTDAGTSPGTDAGTSPGTDAGITPRIDAGTTPRVDAGTGRMCDGSMLTPASGPYCTAATRTCTEACADGTCIFTCLEADASPDCARCANNNILACINANGCQAAWDVYNCCIVDNCSSATDVSACTMTWCSASSDAYDTCIMGVPSTAMCGTTWLDCF